MWKCGNVKMPVFFFFFFDGNPFSSQKYRYSMFCLWFWFKQGHDTTRAKEDTKDRNKYMKCHRKVVRETNKPTKQINENEDHVFLCDVGSWRHVREKWNSTTKQRDCRFPILLFCLSIKEEEKEKKKKISTNNGKSSWVVSFFLLLFFHSCLFLSSFFFFWLYLTTDFLHLSAWTRKEGKKWPRRLFLEVFFKKKQKEYLKRGEISPEDDDFSFFFLFFFLFRGDRKK